MDHTFLESTIDLYQKKSKIYNSIGVVLIIIIGGLFVYKYFYQDPREKEVAGAIYHIQYQFGLNDTSVAHYNLLLEGESGKYRGAKYLADNFPATKAGNLAKFYAGYAYYSLGDYDKSIQYLEECSIDDVLVNAKSVAVLADAYAEKQQLERAADLYLRAADIVGDNILYGPVYYLRAGILFDESNNTDKAIQAFKTALSKFPYELDANITDAIPDVFEELKRNLARLYQY